MINFLRHQKYDSQLSLVIEVFASSLYMKIAADLIETFYFLFIAFELLYTLDYFAEYKCISAIATNKKIL